MSAGAGSMYARRCNGRRGAALDAPRPLDVPPQGRPVDLEKADLENPLVESPLETTDLESLYRRYRTAVYAYLVRMTGNTEDAKDLTQEVFLKAHRQLPPGTTALYPRAWLFQIATYTCFDFFRRKRTRVATQSTPDDLHEPYASDPYEQSQVAAAVGESLRRLPARHRAAIILKDIHGLKHAEIAAAMEITEGAAQVLLHRARGEFRDVFLGLSPAGGVCPIAHRLATGLVGADLTLAQRRELRDHAKTCPECGRYLEEQRVPFGALGFIVAPMAVPEDLPPDLPSPDGLGTGRAALDAAADLWPGSVSSAAVPSAETVVRLAAPFSDWTMNITSKVGALLLAVALTGAGHIGASTLPSTGGGPDLGTQGPAPSVTRIHTPESAPGDGPQAVTGENARRTAADFSAGPTLDRRFALAAFGGSGATAPPGVDARQGSGQPGPNDAAGPTDQSAGDATTAARPDDVPAPTTPDPGTMPQNPGHAGGAGADPSPAGTEGSPDTPRPTDPTAAAGNPRRPG